MNDFCELQSIITELWNKTDLQRRTGADANIVKLMEPGYGPEEIMAFIKPLLTSKVTMGEETLHFEKEFAGKFGFNDAIFCNSGSSANLLAISALLCDTNSRKLKPGDEVLCPALCWSTSVFPLIQCQLVPVFIDINLEDLSVDVKELEKAISEKTSAIMLVHPLGGTCKMDAISAVAQKHNLVLIEDCCESLGANYKGLPVGRFGAAATFSFYFAHHITTIEGGMVCTMDERLGKIVRCMRAHGRDSEITRSLVDPSLPSFFDKYRFIELGYNFKPTDCQAAMGRVQLKKLSEVVNHRRNIAHLYIAELTKFSDKIQFQEEVRDSFHSYFWFSIILRPSTKYKRDYFVNFLKSKLIETRPLIAGNMAKQPAMKDKACIIRFPLKNADYVMENGFALPVHLSLTHKEITYISRAFQEFFQ